MSGLNPPPAAKDPRTFLCCFHFKPQSASNSNAAAPFTHFKKRKASQPRPLAPKPSIHYLVKTFERSSIYGRGTKGRLPSSSSSSPAPWQPQPQFATKLSPRCPDPSGTVPAPGIQIIWKLIWEQRDLKRRTSPGPWLLFQRGTGAPG